MATISGYAFYCNNLTSSGSIITNSSIYQNADGVQGLFHKNGTNQTSKLWGTSSAMFWTIILRCILDPVQSLQV